MHSNVQCYFNEASIYYNLIYVFILIEYEIEIKMPVVKIICKMILVKFLLNNQL
jgi:hypothetical protein